MQLLTVHPAPAPAVMAAPPPAPTCPPRLLPPPIHPCPHTHPPTGAGGDGCRELRGLAGLQAPQGGPQGKCLEGGIPGEPHICCQGGGACGGVGALQRREAGGGWGQHDARGSSGSAAGQQAGSSRWDRSSIRQAGRRAGRQAGRGAHPLEAIVCDGIQQLGQAAQAAAGRVGCAVAAGQWDARQGDG